MHRAFRSAIGLVVAGLLTTGWFPVAVRGQEVILLPAESSADAPTDPAPPPPDTPASPLPEITTLPPGGAFPNSASPSGMPSATGGAGSAAGGAGAAGTTSTFEEGTEQAVVNPPTSSQPWWRRVPIIQPFPLPGNFIIPPQGPGYYSLLDLLEDNYRAKPPRYPYPRFSIMTSNFFDADFRYLDDPKNTETDFFDPIKRVHLGDNFLFSMGGEFRYRHANEVDSRLSGRDNVYDLNRVRLYGDLWYRDLVRVYVEFLDSQSFNQNLPPIAADRDFGDLLNAFVDLKMTDIYDQPVYFRAGRQELVYGSQRLISALDWANTRRTFQGGKMFYRGAKWDVDLFCVQPVIPNATRFDSVDSQQVFSGVFATYRPRAKQEMDFYYLNLDNNHSVSLGANTPGPFNISTVGARYAGKQNNWLWDEEGMLQFGNFAHAGDFARAFTAGFGYYFQDLPMTPELWAYYDFASGDPNPGSGGVHQTFNQLFPFNHYYFGTSDLVGRQNINDINCQLSLYPTKWVTFFMQYHILRLDSPKDALYNSAGVATRQDITGRAGTDVGEVLDGMLNFHLDKHQDILLNYAHLFQGNFIRRTGPMGSPDFLWVQYSYRF